MQAELIDHVKSELQDFELDYREGAWENFNRRQNKEPRSGWFLLAKAAVFLVIFCLFLGGLKLDDKHLKTVAFRSPQNGVPSNKYTVNVTVMPKKQVSFNKSNATGHLAAIGTDEDKLVDTTFADAAYTMPESKPVVAGVTPMVPAAVKQAKTLESLLQESGHDNASGAGMPAKTRWSFALAVGGAMDSRRKGKLNLGAEVNFKLNDKLSINTGIFYNQLGAKKANNGTVETTNDKTLISAEASTYGAELPLQVSYHLNKRLYAKAGISAYSIARQEQLLQFSEQKAVVTSYTDPEGIVHVENRVVNEISTEAVAPEKLKQNKFVALYNLSFGFTQHIGGRSLSLEPYLKIPVQNFSEQKLNLSQAGVRAVFNF
jgi:hypothetical protein